MASTTWCDVIIVCEVCERKCRRFTKTLCSACYRKRRGLSEEKTICYRSLVDRSDAYSPLDVAVKASRIDALAARAARELPLFPERS